MKTDPLEAGKPAAAAAPATGTRLRTFELTIWEKAEHWQFYETMKAASEDAVRAQFGRAYGKGYRLVHVHVLN